VRPAGLVRVREVGPLEIIAIVLLLAESPPVAVILDFGRRTVV